VPRGIVDDPWDYEVVHEGIRILSNPVVVNDKIYFIATDGLVWMADGVSVTEAGSSFDLTKFDDYDENKPCWLVYTERFNGLLVFYPTGSSDKLSTISLANGGVGNIDLQELSDSSAADPKSIISVENSSDVGVYVSHNAQSTDTDRIVLGSLSFGDKITGIDEITEVDDDYWYGRVQTGEIYISPEGTKVGIKHVIIDTYTDTDAATDNPDVIVEVKSLEDTEWHSAQDEYIEEAITVTDAACTLSSSAPPGAFSYKLGTATGGNDTFDLPWLATNVDVYSETGGTYTPCTLVTSAPSADDTYQISDTQEIVVQAAANEAIYAYCNNEPVVMAAAGDYVESDEGFHRITSITNYITAVLDRYKASGSDADAIHYHAEQMPAGSGKIKVAVNKATEGVLVRITILPRHEDGETDQPTVAKITGISFGYVPVATKTLEATGG
jgi:hypothetical protein